MSSTSRVFPSQINQMSPHPTCDRTFSGLLQSNQFGSWESLFGFSGGLTACVAYVFYPPTALLLHGACEIKGKRQG